LSVSLIKTYSHPCEGDMGHCPRTATHVVTYAHEFTHEANQDEMWLSKKELCSLCARWTYPGEHVHRHEHPGCVYTVSVLSVGRRPTDPVHLPA
jgi:hypothetical protein